MTATQASAQETISLTPPVSTPQPRVITNKVIKDRVTFLRRTDGKGSPTVLEIELAPKGGNMAHIHTSYDETFTCIRGTLGVNVAGRRVHLETGQEATAHAGTVHHFFNPTEETVVFRVELVPGHQGFEQSLIVGYGLANDGLTDDKSLPKNLLHTAVLLSMGGMKLPPGVMTLLAPVLGLLAAFARRWGLEKKLTEKYGA